MDCRIATQSANFDLYLLSLFFYFGAVILEKLPLSISIISFNEEKNIGRTLDSVKDIASEIIIVDSHSTDKTIEIAKSYGAKVFTEDWKGHVAQKNSALKKCTQDWILSLDCDEVVSGELRQSIIDTVSRNKGAAYSVNRKTNYLGKLLHYAWQPDWNLRLVKKETQPYWQGLNPHDELKCNSSKQKLRGELVHYSYKDVRNHFDKTLDYAQISAKSYKERGRKFSIWNLLLNPIVAFVRLYIIRKGFLDGKHGLVAGFSTFVYTFLKYVFFWELELKEKKNNKK